MKHGKIKSTAFVLLLVYIFCGAFTPKISASGDLMCTEALSLGETGTKMIDENIKISSRLYELLSGKDTGDATLTLAVGGYAFGLKIKEDGVSITESSMGTVLKTGDRITAVNGHEVHEPSEIENEVKNSGGRPVNLTLMRSGEKISISVSPKNENGEYKLGIKLRSSASGIGTVTFIDPETGIFGGLGHGVSDASGELLTMESGISTNVILGNVKRGEAGKPGELSGVLGSKSTGTLMKNTECGIFGTLESPSKEGLEILPVGRRGELKCGEAEIISTVRNGKSERYKIEIYDIDYSSEGSKSFKIKVCDPKLVALTGGIVRGMSGSPVLQNGKLVGALTHVMVGDPTAGYGIFIENMLTAMKAK